NKALGLCKTLARHHANRQKVRLFKLRPLIEISFPDRRLSDGGDACSSQARLIVVGFKIRLKRCPTSRQLPVQHKSLYIKGPSGSFIGQKAGLPVLRNLGRAGAVAEAGAVGMGRSVIEIRQLAVRQPARMTFRAEREGFEPSIPFRVYTLSRRAR